jgi:hypothetical protein
MNRKRSRNNDAALSQIPRSRNTGPSGLPTGSERHSENKRTTTMVWPEQGQHCGDWVTIPPRLRNGLINGIFESEAELEKYRHELKALQGDPLDYYPDGYPKLPAFLDRRPIRLEEAA